MLEVLVFIIMAKGLPVYAPQYIKTSDIQALYIVDEGNSRGARCLIAMSRGDNLKYWVKDLCEDVAKKVKNSHYEGKL